MKRLALFSTLFLFLLAVSACTHDWVVPANDAIKGDWQWTYSTGGVGGDSLAPINRTLITLNLNNDSTYVYYLNNMPQDSGTYSMQHITNKSLLHMDHGIIINQLSMEPEQLIVVWDSSSLQLQDYNISDGFNHYFKKVK